MGFQSRNDCVTLSRLADIGMHVSESVHFVWISNTVTLTFGSIVDDGEDIDENSYPVEEG
jgi:hypothetical protein